MDILPSVGILYELQAIHDTGYLVSQASPEDYWHQVNIHFIHSTIHLISSWFMDIILIVLLYVFIFYNLLVRIVKIPELSL